jgi:hypothetical protein
MRSPSSSPTVVDPYRYPAGPKHTGDPRNRARVWAGLRDQAQRAQAVIVQLALVCVSCSSVALAVKVVSLFG